MKSFTGRQDAPEDGEILSDELEDISDDSMIFTLNNGKSLSRSDHLPALSLSSVTDCDMDHNHQESPPPVKRHKRRKSYSERYARQKKRRRRKTLDSDSSDNDEAENRRLKYQLKAAVRIDVKEAHHMNNSLRTRLRAMVKGSSEPESEEMESQKQTVCSGKAVGDVPLEKSVEAVEPPITIIDLVDQDTSSCIEILSDNGQDNDSTPESASEQPTKGEEVDNELIELRLAALKTAINNKFANRKKKLKDTNVSSDDTNKENTSNNSDETKDLPLAESNKIAIPEISPQTSGEPKNNEATSPDEDEDVLRALLLASISKKITKIHSEPSKTTSNKVQTQKVINNQNKILLNKLRSNNFKLTNHTVKRVLTNVQKAVNKELGTVNHLAIPKVKPLIISMSSDSESDWYMSSSPEKSPKKAQKGNTDNGSLKRDMEKVKEESTEEVHNPSSEIENTVEQFLKEQRAKVESQLKTEDKKEETNKPDILSVPPHTPKKENVLEVKSEIPQKTLSEIKSRISSTSPSKPNLVTPQLDKSTLKFLPANKREEYKKLQNLLKQKKAMMKKPKTKRISQKKTDNSKNLKITVGSTTEHLKSVTSNNYERVMVQSNTVTATKTSNASSAATLNSVSRVVIHNATLKTTAPPNLPKIVAPIQLMKSTVTNASKRVVQPSIKPKTAVRKFVSNRSTQTVETNQVRLPQKIEARLQELRNEEIKAAQRELEKKKETLVLRSVLNQLGAKKDGRLQIQDKYKCLRPFAQKLNQITKERKHWATEVERLMLLLAEARSKQEQLHEAMLASVKNLAEEKKRIDASYGKPVAHIPKSTAMITSTPIKPTTTPHSIDSPQFTSTSLSGNEIATSTLQTESSIELECSLANSTLVEKGLLDTWEQSTICNSNDKDNEGSLFIHDISDPNDIDKVIKATVEKVAVLEKTENLEAKKSEKVRYVSPLDVGQRSNALDPFGIMCPFEVNGKCKDSECIYNHLSKC